MGIASQICLLSCACTATAARFGAETLRNALGSPPKERRYAGAPPVVALQRQFDRYTAGFGLHYVDCGSYPAHTLAGRAFLMTNVPFLFAGSRLASVCAVYEPQSRPALCVAAVAVLWGEAGAGVLLLLTRIGSCQNWEPLRD